MILLCALVAFFDGFDTQSIGPAGSAIAMQLGIKLSGLGVVFTASQVGFLLGALIFSALGDRLGRKRVLIVATAIFAVCTLATALVNTFPALLACRLLTGVGLGGATPNFISLACEFSRPKHRSRIVMLIWAAVPFGGMTGSFASAAIIPAFGWQTIFFIGSAAPLVLVPALWLLMPESREIHASTGDGANASRFPVRDLFTYRRTPATLLLWSAFFMAWMTLIVVAFWTPALLQKAGLSVAASASVLALNNGGGVLGTVLVGLALGWLPPHRVLIATFAAAAAFIAAMGFSLGHFDLLALSAVFAGFFSSAAAGVSSLLLPAFIRRRRARPASDGRSALDALARRSGRWSRGCCSLEDGEYPRFIWRWRLPPCSRRPWLAFLPKLWCPGISQSIDY